jgi:phosphoribosylformylglycinamidine synthase
VLGIVGLVDDVTKAMPAHFQQDGDIIVLIEPNLATSANWQQELGSSEYARQRWGMMWGTPPSLNLEREAALHAMLQKLAEKNYILSASDVSDGGLAVALARAGFRSSLGAKVALDSPERESFVHAYFSEPASQVIVTCTPNAQLALQQYIQNNGDLQATLIGRVTSGEFVLTYDGEEGVSTNIQDLRKPWRESLDEHFAGEVVTA